MIQPRSMLEVADNSGAKKVQCIRVMGGANKRYASIGDTVIVAVKEAAPGRAGRDGQEGRGGPGGGGAHGEGSAPQGRLVHPLRP